MEDDVNHLREVIRQLRDELHQIKANGINPIESNGGHSAAWIRRSLHLLRSSLNRPRMLPHTDEEAVEKLCIQVEKQSAASEGEDSNISELSNIERVMSDSQLVQSEIRSSNGPQCCASEGECTKEQDSDDIDVKMEEGISEQDEAMIVHCDEPVVDVPRDSDQKTSILDKTSSGLSLENNNTLSSSANKTLNAEPESKTEKDDCYSCPEPELVSEEPTCIPVEESCTESPNRSVDCASSPTLRIVSSEVSPVHKSPTPGISPRTHSSRKSLRTSFMLTASQKEPMDKSFLAPTEHLAASIRHGLEIIDSHRKSSAFRRSSFRFSYKPVDSKIVLPVSKIDVGVQTVEFLPSSSTPENRHPRPTTDDRRPTTDDRPNSP